MPHDRYNQQLSEGDKVLAEFIVRRVSKDPTLGCNIGMDARWYDPKTGYIPHIDCNSGMVELFEGDVISLGAQLAREKSLRPTAEARAEAAEQSLAQQRWIPVSEKLPEVGAEVLISYGGGMKPPCFLSEFEKVDEGFPRWRTDGGLSVLGVTHWRELPSAPTEAK